MEEFFVNEGSTSYHPLTITGKDGQPVTPESLRYRLVNNLGLVMIEWTDLDIEAVEVEIPASMNVIGDWGKKRYLTIEATHNGGDKITNELMYSLTNLKGIS